MVYSPTTWAADDVISSAKLNKIEQGVKTATLLSGTDIDADKNWNGKNITNVGTLSANSLILSEPEFIIAPVRTTNAEYLLKSSDAEKGGNSSTDAWVLLKSLPPLPASVLSASVYVSYDLRSSNAPVKARIYVNGEAVGTVQSHPNSSYTTYGEVINGIGPGDVIQIYGQRNPSTSSIPYVRNLRVYGVTIQSIPRPLGSW
jgi:hypothetical protein